MSMNFLGAYGSSDDDDDASNKKLRPKMLAKPVNAAPQIMAAPQRSLAVVNPLSKAAGPIAKSQTSGGGQLMMMHNPRAEVFLAPIVGPAHPYRQKQAVPTGGSHTGAGVVERAGVEDWSFKDQYNTYQQHGYTTDTHGVMVGDVNKGLAMEQAAPLPRDRKRKHRDSSGAAAAAAAAALDVGDEATSGIWAPVSDDGKVMTDAQAGTMTEQQQKYREEYLAEKAKKNKEYNMEEDHDRRDERKLGHMLPPRHNRDTTAADASSVFHGKAQADYAGRSWIEPPSGMRPGEGEHQAFPPKKCIHKWTGHTKGVQVMPITYVCILLHKCTYINWVYSMSVCHSKH
jgi:pre-mRNA-processing factor 17